MKNLELLYISYFLNNYVIDFSMVHTVVQYTVQYRVIPFCRIMHDPGGPMRLTVTVLEEDGRIVGRWGRGAIALAPAGPAEFMIGFLRNGDLFDVADEMTLRILVENGVSTGAEFLWEGEVFGIGEKVGC